MRKAISPVGNWESGANPGQPSLLCLASAISQNTSAAVGYAGLDDEEVQPIIHIKLCRSAPIFRYGLLNYIISCAFFVYRL